MLSLSMAHTSVALAFVIHLSLRCLSCSATEGSLRGSNAGAPSLTRSSKDSRELTSAVRRTDAIANVGSIRWANHPNKCLEVADYVAHDGSRIQLSDCIQGHGSQGFEWSGDRTTLRLGANPNLCVDVADHRTSNGNHIQLWDCQSDNSDQLFDITAPTVGKIKWANHPTKCLDVKDHSQQNGNSIQLWDCIGDNSDQNFAFGDTPPSPTPPPSPNTAYDVIIVGAGVAGSAVAAKLAEKLPNLKILTLEGGKASQKILGGEEPPASVVNGAWQSWPEVNGGLTRYDVPGNYPVMNCWSAGCSEQAWTGLPAYQCKILGGCGVMNGALAQVPQPEMFDKWPKAWSWEDMESYFTAAQQLFHVTQTPSADGVHYLNDTGADYLREALSGAGFIDGNPLEAKAGIMGVPFVTAKDGIRQSTASVLLPDALSRPNFELALESTVTQLIHESGRATGVRYTQHSTEKVASLTSTGMVVLTAGVFNTARLLLGSGMGNDQVGKDISDHTHHGGSFTVDKNAGVGSFAYSPPNDDSIAQYNEGQNGPLAQFGPTFVAYIKDPSTEGDEDDIDVEVWIGAEGENSLSLGLVLMRPTCSSADLYVEGSDNHVKIANDHLHEACQRDRDTIAYAKELVTKQLESVGAYGGFGSGDDMNHWSGSCKLGKCADPDTLVVYGTDNVAVADSSVFPEPIWGHPSLTLEAFALKAADVLASQIGGMLV